MVRESVAVEDCQLWVWGFPVHRCTDVAVSREILEGLATWGSFKGGMVQFLALVSGSERGLPLSCRLGCVLGDTCGLQGRTRYG